jgi:hypothetical protein
MLWNPEVHYCLHGSSVEVFIPSQINPFHALPPDFFKAHFNIIPLYMAVF